MSSKALKKQRNVLFLYIGLLTQNVDFIKSDEASYEDIRHGFGTPKGHPFSL